MKLEYIRQVTGHCSVGKSVIHVMEIKAIIMNNGDIFDEAVVNWRWQLSPRCDIHSLCGGADKV